MAKRDLIEALERIRNEKQWSDGEMAEVLGCARTTYLGARNGTTPIGMAIVQGVAVRFPDLLNLLSR